MPNASTGLPGIPTAPVVDQSGLPTPVWWQFFLNLWNRTGGAGGTPSLVIDTISSTMGAILYRGAAQWQGLNPAPQFRTLRMGVQFPEWDLMDGNSFGQQAAGRFFASPPGASGIPAFIDPQGQYPGTTAADNALAGNLGEYVFSQIDAGSAVPLSSGTPKDITSIPLTPGDWDVWGSVVTAPAPTTTTSLIASWMNTASATDPGPPNSGAYGQTNWPIAAGLGAALPIGQTRILVGAAEPVFLSTKINFAVSTMSAYGFLGARRVR